MVVSPAGTSSPNTSMQQDRVTLGDLQQQLAAMNHKMVAMQDEHNKSIVSMQENLRADLRAEMTSMADRESVNADVSKTKAPDSANNTPATLTSETHTEPTSEKDKQSAASIPTGMTLRVRKVIRIDEAGVCLLASHPPTLPTLPIAPPANIHTNTTTGTLLFIYLFYFRYTSYMFVFTPRALYFP